MHNYDAPTTSDALHAFFDGQKGMLMTALPGHLLAYSPSKQRAQIKIGIKRRRNDTWLEIPPCIDVPVLFPGSQSWSLFFDLKEGDEGLVVFSQRAADRWKQHGGVQEPHDIRSFSATDAFFIPGARSDKTAFPAFPAGGIGLTDRANDVQTVLTSSQLLVRKGQTSVTLTDSAATVKRGSTLAELTDTSITATLGSTSIAMTPDGITLTAGGSTLMINAAGVAIAGASVTNNGVNIGATHVHSQKNDFSGDKQNDTEVPH